MIRNSGIKIYSFFFFTELTHYNNNNNYSCELIDREKNFKSEFLIIHGITKKKKKYDGNHSQIIDCINQAHL